ncbi:hypothetical protein GCM10007874_11130 [Labrys miyagiensis]|uniref:Uncharacterized protein n=2 Tax=Labrys miyagiensis TaxID=346912 RepID=A0ABQ6CEK9_9HYPH|nr:hypothetical protein GCM10007874_11130 [Labrys miyagiensis]
MPLALSQHAAQRQRSRDNASANTQKISPSVDYLPIFHLCRGACYPCGSIPGAAFMSLATAILFGKITKSVATLLAIANGKDLGDRRLGPWPYTGAHAQWCDPAFSFVVVSM